MRWKIITLFLLTIALTLSMASVSRADTVGIDVSRWQGTIDWNAVKGSTMGFAIIKAGGSDGELYMDSQFQRNRDEARRLAIPRGYYYFAGGGNPVAEAEHFASIVGPLQPGEVVALDYEIDHPDPVGYSLQFLVRTEQLLGVKPLMYTYMNKIWTINWQPVVNNGNRLWGAIYDENPVAMPAPGQWPGVTMKQYSSSGVIPGISANSVDLNFLPGPNNFTDFGKPEPPKPTPPRIEVDHGLQEITASMLPTDVTNSAGETTAGETTAVVTTESSEAMRAATDSIDNGTLLPESKPEVQIEWIGEQLTDGGKVAITGGNEVGSLDPRTRVGSVMTGVLFPLKQIVAIASGDDEDGSQEQDAGVNDAVESNDAGKNQQKDAPSQTGGENNPDKNGKK